MHYTAYSSVAEYELTWCKRSKLGPRAHRKAPTRQRSVFKCVPEFAELFWHLFFFQLKMMSRFNNIVMLNCGNELEIHKLYASIKPHHSKHISNSLSKYLHHSLLNPPLYLHSIQHEPLPSTPSTYTIFKPYTFSSLTILPLYLLGWHPQHQPFTISRFTPHSVTLMMPSSSSVT